MAEMPAHDTRSVLCILPDCSDARRAQGRWTEVGRCGSSGILVSVFLPGRHSFRFLFQTLGGVEGSKKHT